MTSRATDLGTLYERYGPMVLRRCRQILRDEDEALDVMQEVFVRLLERPAILADLYPSSFLYRVATNLCLNRLRDKRRRAALPGDEVLHRIACMEHLDAPLLLDRLFRKHPESTRTMAVLHFWDGMTLEQVARECRMSVSGVRKRLRGLRASLQTMEAP